MKIPRMLAAVAIALVVGATATGCSALFLWPENEPTLEAARLTDCWDEYDLDVPGSDHVAPDDHPYMRATVEITNVSNGVREYSVRADIFTKDGEKVGGMSTHVSEIEPGVTVTETLLGDMSIAMPDEGVDCVLREIVVED